MKVREILLLLKQDGWYQVKGKDGSHRQFKHPVKPGKTTVSGHPGDDIIKETLASVLRQAGLKERRS
jgi:predicted RNA binding protein YcfA (HicA-like mRNA interferase family)